MAFVSTSLIASVSYAAGQSSDMSAPAFAVQSTPVAIKIRGRGTCTSRVTFGDGRYSKISNRNFPHKYTHRYKLTGVYTIKANITGVGCSSVIPLSTRIKITARTGGTTPRISTNKLQPRRRLPPALNKRQRSAIHAV